MSDLGNKEIMAKNLTYYMKINNKDRNDICNTLDIPYTTFTDWVNGVTYPRIDKIELLANYFNIQKSDLIENKEKNETDAKLEIYYSKMKELSPRDQEIVMGVIDSISKQLEEEQDK